MLLEDVLSIANHVQRHTLVTVAHCKNAGLPFVEPTNILIGGCGFRVLPFSGYRDYVCGSGVIVIWSKGHLQVNPV